MYNMIMQNGYDTNFHILRPSSTPLTMEFVMLNWLKFIPQISPDTYYLPRYLIPNFLLEHTIYHG